MVKEEAERLADEITALLDGADMSVRVHVAGMLFTKYMQQGYTMPELAALTERPH